MAVDSSRTIRRRFRRLWRWVRRPIEPARAQLVYSRHYAFDLPIAVYDPRRGERVLTFLAAENLLGRGVVHRSRRASMAQLRRVHTDDYLESLQHPGGLDAALGCQLSDALHDEAIRSFRAVVGGTRLATELALRSGGIAVNLGGGTHHAHADRGAGFCLFNDVAVSIAGVRRAGFEEPILVIDLDIHDGDGTRDLYRRDTSVHTLSIHNRHLGPTEAEASTSVELGDGVRDELYLARVMEHVPDVLERTRPGLIFYLAGCDPARDDRLGNWDIGRRAMLERDLFVMDRCRAMAPGSPVVILLAGGYGQGAWRYSARFISSLLTGGKALEPELTTDHTLDHYRRLTRTLDIPGLVEAAPSNEWGLSEEDLPLGWAPRTSRFLDHYSLHGIELALERYGLLESLRQRGFRHPRLDLQVDESMGNTLRVLTDGHEEAPAVLVELRVRRDRGLIKGMELLSVEWLLLQNPLSRERDGLPLLPGQAHPGLGMLRDVVALLIMACEQLELDGFVFKPAHYHIAAQTGRRFHFLEPKAEASYQALHALLKRLPLAEAARALEEGRVQDSQSGRRVKWEPESMILPVGRRLRRMMEGPRYRRRVETAAHGLRYEIVDRSHEGGEG